MKKDIDNINARRPDDKAAKSMVYIVCVLIILVCTLLDVYLIIGILE